MATDTAPDRIRYGVIGTGMMGGEHLLNLASIPDAEIVAISDPNGESLDGIGLQTTPFGEPQPGMTTGFTPQMRDAA